MNKKGQEEMVGFVMIVIIVAVVFLILLGIFLRQEPSASEADSVEVTQFLESIMGYTSSCAVSYEPAYSSVGELIEECYRGKKCVGGEDSCEVLEQTVRDILGSGWEIGEEFYYKGYEFKIVGSEETILEISNGNCENEFIGSEYLIPGDFVSSLKLCL